MKQNIFGFLVVFFFLHFFFRVYSFKNAYITQYNPTYWKERYQKSQWVTFMSKEPIGDDGLYAYAGWEYVHGQNPILNSPEAPPLGKYLIGLSIMVFGNQNIFALIVGILVLSTFYIHNLEIFKDRFLSFIPVFLFSFEPLFFQQLKAPYLDLLQLLFLLLVFICIYRKKIILSGIFLGCFAATKNTYLSLLIATTIFGYLFLLKNKLKFLHYFLSLFISVLVFIFSYGRFFWLGNSFLDFLKVQKGVLVTSYFMAAKSKFGIVIPMLLTGHWFTWWDGVERVGEWLPIWSVLLIILIYYLATYRKKILANKLALNILWIGVYFFFLLFVPVFPRYLLLLLPFMYNLCVWVFSKNIASKFPLS